MKKCQKCKIEKEDNCFSPSQFARKYGWCYSCTQAAAKKYNSENKDKRKQYKEHNKTSIKQKNAIYYSNNKEKINKRGKIYRDNNKEKCSQIGKNYYKNNIIQVKEMHRKYNLNNKDRNNKRNQNYYQNNKKLIIKRTSKNATVRRHNNLSFRLRTVVSSRINYELKKKSSSKQGKSCLNYLSYTMEELKEHLENQFEPWMNWNNYGNYKINSWDDNDPKTWKWSIDHIIPQALLPYTSMRSKNFKKCWALDNLRPLNAKENLLKGNKR